MRDSSDSGLWSRYVLRFGVLVVLHACPVGAGQVDQGLLSHPLLEVVDVNPDPHVFEAALSVDEQDVAMDGTIVRTTIYKDLNNLAMYAEVPDRIPLPQITVDLGDEIVVTLLNQLSPCGACDTSIHWHGIELDNDSDGTGITQNRVRPGETYTYRFKTNRPGIFWFHPHMKPGPQVFAGAYGAFVVRDPKESLLRARARIPAAESSHTIVLSDIEFDESGRVGYLVEGPDAVSWGELHSLCRGGDTLACTSIRDGATVLVNGHATDRGPSTIRAKSGSGIRLRCINAATHRYFRLAVSGNGDDNRLYRIGGEGGFLERVRLEGGVESDWDTKYSEGEIVLPPGARADVVVVPSGPDGAAISILGTGYGRRGPSHNNPAGELLSIQIDNALPGDSFSISEGDEILGDGSVVDLKTLSIVDSFTAPLPELPGPGSGSGSSDETISMGALIVGRMAIDGVSGSYADSGDDYRTVPYQGTTRYAKTGDTLELVVTQSTGQHHPFHLHGFSFQPVRVIDSRDGSTLYDFDYNEFVDVIDVFSGQSVVIRVQLQDRPRITDDRPEEDAPEGNERFPSGGARGRWLFHCHTFLHSAIGMVAELVVEDADRDEDGFDTSVDCDDFDPSTYPGAFDGCDDVDNDCDGLIDEDSMPPEIVVPVEPLRLRPGRGYANLSVADRVRAVEDDCSALTVEDVRIVSVTSDELCCRRRKSECTEMKIASDCRSVRLRRRRRGFGNGRVYTVHLELTGDDGEVAAARCIVTVPRHPWFRAVDDGAVVAVSGRCHREASAWRHGFCFTRSERARSCSDLGKVKHVPENQRHHAAAKHRLHPRHRDPPRAPQDPRRRAVFWPARRR